MLCDNVYGKKRYTNKTELNLKCLLIDILYREF